MPSTHAGASHERAEVLVVHRQKITPLTIKTQVVIHDGAGVRVPSKAKRVLKVHTNKRLFLACGHHTFSNSFVLFLVSWKHQQQQHDLNILALVNIS